MNINDSTWRPYVPSSSSPWDLRRAKHLRRRACFGATWDELQQDIASGPTTSVDRMLAGQARSYAVRDDFDEMSAIIADAAVGSGEPQRLKAAWMFRMLFTPDPLREKLTLMWHNHFATSNLKVKNLSMMRVQNDLLRQRATGKFVDLLKAVLRDPAMLVWLDAGANRKQHPNENLARELMELFTLGVGHYSENDVREAARALSGWTLRRDATLFREERHDAAAKTILGQTGNFNTDSLADLLLQNEATSRRIAWRLCDTFMGESALSDTSINELATGLREHELNIGWAVEVILRSELFFADANIGTRISSPIEFVVGSVRSLELLGSSSSRPPSTLILSDWCTRLEQDLFQPPNVGGWTGGRNWLTSRSIVGRANFATALVAGQLHTPTLPPDLNRLLKRQATAKASASGASTSRVMAELLPGEMPDDLELEKLESENVSDVVASLLRRPEAVLI